MAHTLASPSAPPSSMRENDLVATYVVRSADLSKAADAIAIGQSIGNPRYRLTNETDKMWDRFGCQIRSVGANNDGTGKVVIGYPAGNLTAESFTHLLAMVMGGQMDIDLVAGCRLIDLDFPDELLEQFSGPQKGIEGIRNYLGAQGRALVGGIVKPKTGITPDEAADICKQMADGGIDFIKEDEILGAIDYCPFETRVEKISRALEGYKVIYAPCVTSPIEKMLDVAEFLRATLKAPAFHYNIWGGLDAFHYLTKLIGGFAFYQKSGDKTITDGRYGVDFSVWCRLARLAGADFMHAGMVGGYLDEPLPVMRMHLEALRGRWCNKKPTLPSLSCGATPGMVEGLVAKFGVDIMVSSGGCLHAHPQGTRAGAKAFRDAAEGKSSNELTTAIEKFGR